MNPARTSSVWAGPVWGEPSTAAGAQVPLRPVVTAGDAAYRAEGGANEHFAVVAASVAGTGHRLARRRCDDAFGWSQAPSGPLVVVVADGVSAARFGGQGAELAVRAACQYVETAQVPDGADQPGDADEELPSGLNVCLGALMAANAVLAATAQDMGIAPMELATTLVVAALSPGQNGAPATVDLVWVGDSAAFVLAGGQEWQEVTGALDDVRDDEGAGPVVPPPEGRPEGGGHHDEPEVPLASTATAALPSAVADEVDNVAVGSFLLEPGDALVLMTDGVAGPLRDGPGTVAPGLAEVLSRGPEGLSPLRLAEAADFNRRGCQDDRTVVAAWGLPGG